MPQCGVQKPYRATKAEEAIAGKTIDVASAQAAGVAAVTGARALTLNKWKIQVAAGMVKKAILALRLACISHQVS